MRLGKHLLVSLLSVGIIAFQLALSPLVAMAASYASDTFSRTVSGSWGTAETGGTWSSSGGSASDYQVNGSTGIQDVIQSGSNRNSWLNISQLAVDLKYRFKTDKPAAGEGFYQFGLLRVKDSANYYSARIKFLTDQRIKVVFTKRVSGSETPIGTETEVSRETHAASTWYWMRAQAEGTSPTMLRLKVWRDGTPEPSAWDYEQADFTSSLQTAGGAGVRSATHSQTSNAPIRYSYDDFAAGSIGSNDPGPAPAPTTTLHVNPVTGNDANTGSAESPYRTIQKALSVVQPGMSIKLASGTYQESNETVTAGTATARITIEPETGAMPILDGNQNTLNAIRVIHSYYTIRGLEIRNVKEGVRLEGVTGVILENNIIYNVYNEGVRLRYFTVGNTIRNNKIYGCGLNGNGEGIYIGTAPEQRYKNNGLPDTSNNNVIAGNEIYNVEEGIDIKEDSSFNTVENNVIHNATDPNSGGINVRADENYLYGNLSYNNAGAGFRFGGDVVWSPIYGNNYHYGVNNVLRNNIANNNAGHSYKFMNGPQDADTSNAGSGNGGQLYYYGVGVEPFISEPDTASPVISNVYATNIGTNSTTIVWTTDEAADSKVEYGLSTAYGTARSDATLVTSHSINFSGLTAATTYHYRVTSKDAAGNTASSADLTFTTNPAPVNRFHIQSITISLSRDDSRIRAQAVVKVVDANGSPVSSATVSGHWSGATSDTDTAQTNSSGEATVRSNWVRRPPSGTIYIFTVDNVGRSGWTYDSAVNVETSDSVVVL